MKNDFPTIFARSKKHEPEQLFSGWAAERFVLEKGRTRNKEKWEKHRNSFGNLCLLETTNEDFKRGIWGTLEAKSGNIETASRNKKE
jgi:hypothetical protein